VIGAPPLPDATEELKVFVKLKSGDTFFAIIYITAGGRLQDLVNDRRAFLPMMRQMNSRSPNSKDIWKFVVLNKDSIEFIEETIDASRAD